MKRRMRTLVAAAVCAATALGLAGCGGSSSASSSPSPSAVSVKFYSDKAAWKPQFETLSKASVKAGGPSLDVVGYSDENTYDSFIKQSLGTKEKPTMFSWQSGQQLAALAKQGVVDSTTDTWSKAIKAGDIDKGIESEYTTNGNQYCFPMNVAYWVMYYNKADFAKYGLQPPKTWADLTNIVNTLKSNGVIPIYQTSGLFSFAWFETLMVGMHPDTYNKLATGEAKYTDPDVVDVMNTWLQEEQDGWFSDSSVTDSPQALLKSGKVAMVNMGTTMSGELKTEGATSDDYGVFAIPAVDPSITTQPMILESDPICVAKGSTNEAAANQFMDWWATTDAQQVWATASDGMSFNPNVTPGDPVLADFQKTTANGTYTYYERYYEATPPPVLTAALDAFGSFVNSPGDPTKLLQDIQTAADSYWADQKG